MSEEEEEIGKEEEGKVLKGHVFQSVWQRGVNFILRALGSYQRVLSLRKLS